MLYVVSQLNAMQRNNFGLERCV